jgi:L-ascorbate metabolism protein UlaG (beta-lactamase superfamily)
MELSLRDSIELHVDYDDGSQFGTTVSGALEARLKQRLQPAIDLLHQGVGGAIEQAPEMFERLGLGGTAEFLDGPGRVREELSFPPASETVPAALRIFRQRHRPIRISIPPELVGDLAARLGEWQRGAKAPSAPGPASELWNALVDLDCLTAPREPAARRGVATFVGHATVQLNGPNTTLLVDPFLQPRGDDFPPGYQPLTAGDCTPDVVLITHSHQDHFNVDTLLRLGRDTPILVPAVDRESSLSADMAHRLGELGFTAVRTLGWNSETTIGDFRIIALPMYGEQPLSEGELPPGIRNTGNTYLVESVGRRYGFIADAGRDHLGDVRSLATSAYERYGAIDVLFGGYRPWTLYPIQYLTSSVPQYLLYTPRSLWQSRQQIMNDEHALLDTAERWHARYVVPYANGGAPWYWQLGLGAVGDGSTQGGRSDHFDPLPEVVVRAAAQRSEDAARPLSSQVRPLVMRPGDSLDFGADGEAAVVANPGHTWPYQEVEAVANIYGAGAEPVGLSRKRVLLRLLATEEMERRGLSISTQQVMDMSDDLRIQNGLVEHADMLDWLRDAGLSMAEYCDILLEWQAVLHLEDAMADPIEKRLAGQRAFASMRNGRR